MCLVCGARGVSGVWCMWCVVSAKSCVMWDWVCGVWERVYACKGTSEDVFVWVFACNVHFIDGCVLLFVCVYLHMFQLKS